MIHYSTIQYSSVSLTPTDIKAPPGPVPQTPRTLFIARTVQNCTVQYSTNLTVQHCYVLYCTAKK